MKKFYYFLLVAFLVGFNCKTIALPLYQLTPECEAYIDQDRYIIHFTLPDYTIEIDNNDNDNYPGQDDECGKYSVIEMKTDYDATDIPSYPVLPFFSLNLLLPDHYGNLSYTPHILQTETIHVDPRITPAFKGGKYIYDPLGDQYVDYDNGDCYDTYYYQHGYDSIYTHGFYMDYFNIDTIYSFFNTNGLAFSIHPFSYHPETGVVNVLKEAEIEISFTGDDLINFVQTYTTMENVTEKVVATHYDTFNDMLLTDASHDNGNYLIIAAAHDMSSYLQPYVSYKTYQHYNVEVLYLDYYGIVGNKSAIRNLIHNNGIMNNPDYVLLVGSLDQIPPFGTSSSILPYTDDGYFHPLIGRWLVKSEYGTYPDIEHLVDKTISSEYDYTNIYSHAALFSGTDNTKRKSKRFYYRMQKIAEQICIPYSFYDGRSSTVDFNAMKNALQTIPCNIFAYGGHGTSFVDYSNIEIATGIANPYKIMPSYLPYIYPYNTIVDLNNSSPYPMGFGFACSLNSYATMDNFGARWCAEKFGGSTFYGATTESFTTSNNYLSKRMFAKMTNITNKIENFPLSLLIHCSEMNYLFALPTLTRLNQIIKYNLIGDPTIYVYGMGSYGIPAPYHMPKSTCFTHDNNSTMRVKQEIYSVNGILMYTLTPGENISDLPLANGMYIIRSLFDDETSETQKITIY